MKSKKFPGVLYTGCIFITAIVILYLSMTRLHGWAGKKNGESIESNSPNFQLNRLQTMMKNGTSEFYRSYSDALKMMAEYEKAAKQNVRFDFAFARTKNKNAILKLQKTREIYRNVVQLCSRKDFQPVAGETWLTNGYAAADALEIALKRSRDRAKRYLKNGDILSIYRCKIENSNHLITIMKQIDRDLEIEIKPDAPLVWTLLQEYSELLAYENHSKAALNIMLLKNWNRKSVKVN